MDQDLNAKRRLYLRHHTGFKISQIYFYCMTTFYRFVLCSCYVRTLSFEKVMNKKKKRENQRGFVVSGNLRASWHVKPEFMNTSRSKWVIAWHMVRLKHAKWNWKKSRKLKQLGKELMTVTSKHVNNFCGGLIRNRVSLMSISKATIDTLKFQRGTEVIGASHNICSTFPGFLRREVFWVNPVIYCPWYIVCKINRVADKKIRYFSFSSNFIS